MGNACLVEGASSGREAQVLVPVLQVRLGVDEKYVEAGATGVFEDVLDELSAAALASVLRKHSKPLQLRNNLFVVRDGAPSRRGHCLPVDPTQHVPARFVVAVPLLFGGTVLLLNKDLCSDPAGLLPLIVALHRRNVDLRHRNGILLKAVAGTEHER